METMRPMRQGDIDFFFINLVKTDKQIVLQLVLIIDYMSARFHFYFVSMT